jgi:hypothetical protein
MGDHELTPAVAINGIKEKRTLKKQNSQKGTDFFMHYLLLSEFSHISSYMIAMGECREKQKREDFENSQTVLSKSNISKKKIASEEYEILQRLFSERSRTIPLSCVSPPQIKS